MNHAGIVTTLLAWLTPVAPFGDFPLPPLPPLPFLEMSIILEVNETDGDAEIVVRAKADEGLKSFWLRRPDGKKVIDVASDDKSKTDGPIGLAQVRFETAEPSLARIAAAYPEGIYEFRGRTIDNALVYGEVVLSHALLPAPAYTPADGDVVDANDAVVEWTPVTGAAFYVVELENDDLAVNLTAIVTGDTASLRIPAGFLLPDTEYDLGVASMTDTGNVAFAESSFLTAP